MTTQKLYVAEDLRIKHYYRGFCNSKTFLSQDIVYSLTTTPGALGGRSGMGLSGTVTSDSSTKSGLPSLSVSTLAEDANTKTVIKKLITRAVQL